MCIRDRIGSGRHYSRSRTPLPHGRGPSQSTSALNVRQQALHDVVHPTSGALGAHAALSSAHGVKRDTPDDTLEARISLAPPMLLNFVRSDEATQKLLPIGATSQQVSCAHADDGVTPQSGGRATSHDSTRPVTAQSGARGLMTERHGQPSVVCHTHDDDGVTPHLGGRTTSHDDVRLVTGSSEPLGLNTTLGSIPQGVLIAGHPRPPAAPQALARSGEARSPRRFPHRSRGSPRWGVALR